MTMPGAPDGGEEIVLDRAKFDAALTDLGDLQTEIATSGEEYAAALSAVAAGPDAVTGAGGADGIRGGAQYGDYRSRRRLG